MELSGCTAVDCVGVIGENGDDICESAVTVNDDIVLFS